MAINEYQKDLLKELVKFVENWQSDDPNYNGILRGQYLVEFVTDLQTKIYNEISMSGKRGQTLLLYTGQSSETGKWIWQDMGEFCSKYSDCYYISSTDAGSILWEPPFQQAVTELIGNKNISTQILLKNIGIAS